MAPLTAAQKKRVKQFVISNYAPKLRRTNLKKFTLTAQKKGLGFIDAAEARKKAKGGAGGGKAATPPAGPYDAYKDLPGAVKALESIDKSSAAHQTWAKGVQDWTAATINPLAQAGAQAQQYYAGLGSQYAQMGALPAQMPNATVGGQVITPGVSTPQLQGATIQGQAAAAAGTQSSTYQGYLHDQANRNLAQGITGHLGSLAQQIPGVYNQQKQAYMQKLDELLFEREQSERESEAEAALEQLKMANDRYIAQMGLVGDLTGEQVDLQLGQLKSDTDLAKTNATNQTKISVANINAATKRAVAQYKGQIDAAKLAVTQAKNNQDKKKANQTLLREVQKAFDALWKGEAPDPLVPGSGHGWRYTARGGKKGREKAAIQVLGWLQTTGLAPGNIHRLMRSKGFSDAEFQRAVRRVEGGGGF